MSRFGSDVAALLGALYAARGGERYMEDATILQHSLQTASLARRAHAAPSLVAAALLHDVGHLLGERDDASGIHAHGEEGARYLERWFGEAVTEPVRLHVSAKRYLCAREEGYVGRLSAASLHTLQHQGGVMDAAEAAAFDQERYSAEAVRLRRWDDEGKRTDRDVAGFAAYGNLLRRLVR